MRRPLLQAVPQALLSWLRRGLLAARQRPWLILVGVLTVVPGLAALAAGLFVAVLFLIRVLWAWTVPDLFPGAVREGLVAHTISWLTALKVLLVALFLSALIAAGRERR